MESIFYTFFRWYNILLCLLRVKSYLIVLWNPYNFIWISNGMLQKETGFFKSSLEDMIIDFRERGRGEERERDINVRKKLWSDDPAGTLTGDWICNLGMCIGQKSNPQPFSVGGTMMMLQPTKPPSQDKTVIFIHVNTLWENQLCIWV